MARLTQDDRPPLSDCVGDRLGFGISVTSAGKFSAASLAGGLHGEESVVGCHAQDLWDGDVETDISQLHDQSGTSSLSPFYSVAVGPSNGRDDSIGSDQSVGCELS